MNIISSYHSASSQSAAADHLKQNSANSEHANNNKAQETLMGKLAEHIPGVSADDMRTQKAEDFTPDKIAERISGFVGMGLEAARREGRSEQDIQKMHDAAMRGISKGFSEAKEILDGLGVLDQGNVKPMIDNTYDKTMSAVKALMPERDYSPSVNQARGSESFYAQRYAQSESFSLSLTTKEGDEVTIELSASSSQQSSFGAVQNANGQAVSGSMERGSSSSMQYSIQGDLNDAEMSAIEDLLKDVNSIADDFFGGDLQQAFDKAADFQMDGSQLASMNLRLERSESYSAAGAYNSVSALPDFEGAEELAPIQDFANTVAGVAEDPRIEFMEQADRFIADLLSQLSQSDIRYIKEGSQEQTRLDNNMKLMSNMLDSMFRA